MKLPTSIESILNENIVEKILKIDGQAEAVRFFNYPYQAIEEALVNAVYHRGYDVREPVEVRIMVQESQNLRQMIKDIILLQQYLYMMDLKMK